uniref:JmjC domain-containing protein n=1 Tax=Steinernema glaseri TaxID=37863 RepID=A0A1I7YV92_9BILA
MGQRPLSGKYPDKAGTWFTFVYPQLKASSDFVRFVEFVQSRGETVFVPSGWWYVNLNLEMTIGITQNFCSLNTLEFVWEKAKQTRPRMYRHWVEELRAKRPEAFRLIEREEEQQAIHRELEALNLEAGGSINP